MIESSKTSSSLLITC